MPIHIFLNFQITNSKSQKISKSQYSTIILYDCQTNLDFEIDFFAVFFLLILGYSFYANSNQTMEEQGILETYAMYSPFLIGVFLNCINFLQLPFWTGWNLYLMNGNYISIVNKLKLYYVSGTLIGTFFGMLILVLILNTLSQNTTSFSKYVIPVVIPSFFVILAFVQMVKVYKKYYRNKVTL